MLISVGIDQLRVGMYVHSVDIAWFRHPFWRRQFLLRSQDDLDRLLASGARSIVIDDSKGLGLPEPDETPPAVEHDIPPKLKERRKAPVSQSFTNPYAVEKDLPQRLTGRARRSEVRRASKTLSRSKAAVMDMFADARLGKAIKTKGIAKLVAQISASVDKDASIILNIARLKTKDEYTFLHSVSVCALMINLARKLGLEPHVVESMGMAGMLHDLGKIAIPEAVLNKPARLSDEEMAVVRNHPQRGYEILSASGSVDSLALDVCLNHHEKMDGTGYPSRTKGEFLSLAARMAAICDVYDAVTSQRSYNTPMSVGDALDMMQSWKGHFDQLLLKAFIESLGLWPIGTLVVLSDGKLGIVIGEDSHDYSQPMVRIFRSIKTGIDLPWRDIRIAHDGHSPTIHHQADPADFGIADWPALSARLLGTPRICAAEERHGAEPAEAPLKICASAGRPSTGPELRI